MEKAYQGGNAVKVDCLFKDYDGNPIDPDLIKIIFYDSLYQKINEYSVSSSYKLDTGNYFFEYITPFVTAETRMYYEWYGEIKGTPSLRRGSFRIVFM